MLSNAASRALFLGVTALFAVNLAAAVTSTSSLGVYTTNSNGVIVGEIEHAPANSHWRFRLNEEGFAGLGYYIWRSNGKQTANPNKGVLAFDVRTRRPQQLAAAAAFSHWPCRVSHCTAHGRVSTFTSQLSHLAPCSFSLCSLLAPLPHTRLKSPPTANTKCACTASTSRATALTCVLPKQLSPSTRHRQNPASPPHLTSSPHLPTSTPSPLPPPTPQGIFLWFDESDPSAVAGGSNDGWTWTTMGSSGPVRMQLSAGRHALFISGRSRDVYVDRWAIFRAGEVSESVWSDLSQEAAFVTTTTTKATTTTTTTTSTTTADKGAVIAVEAPRSDAPAMYRINVGGAGFQDSFGQAWDGDLAFEGGRQFRVDSPIANIAAADQALFRSERNGMCGARHLHCALCIAWRGPKSKKKASPAVVGRLNVSPVSAQVSRTRTASFTGFSSLLVSAL